MHAIDHRLRFLLAATLTLAAASARAQTPIEPCLGELGAPFPAAPSDDGTQSSACEHLGAAPIAALASIVSGDDEADVALRIVTARGETTLRLGARRRARGYDALAIVDSLRVVIASLDGAPRVALVTVATFVAGEDDSWHDDTLVVVALGSRPRVIWVGPGDYERGRLGACTMTRTASVSVRGSALHVRSQVDATLDAPGMEGLAPDLRAVLARECVAPRRVHADVPLP